MFEILSEFEHETVDEIAAVDGCVDIDVGFGLCVHLEVGRAQPPKK